MSTNRFNVLVVVALLVVAALTAWEVAAIANVVADDRSAPAVAFERRDRVVSQNRIDLAASHRVLGDECFEVRDLVDCRLTSQKPGEIREAAPTPAAIR